jgi:AcrR family transcriptional regulator
MQGREFERPKKRAKQKAESRQRLIDAALRVFARNGILAATSAEIAEEAGLSHGSLFSHFGSQEALLAEAISTFGALATSRLHELCERGAGTREVLAAHLETISEREDFYSRLVVEAPMLPPVARQSLVIVQSTIAFHLAPALEADRAAGLIRDLALPLLFNTWLGLIHYYLANRDLFAPGASLVERRGEELLDHFMSMISIGGTV